jgi:hypothetical protein
MSAFRLALVTRTTITLITLKAAPTYITRTAWRTGEGVGRSTADLSAPPG